ncbi:hypothetical protein GCM10025870_08180 [Agromyces marinus]|uniref:Uncharacterized protein n=1 Tax=Agromyces marinus TaxID=1389020 RepID=A0ABN6YCS0_9MICO|nr:DegT/DnrJ/EryC1/StrS family aminotransferase [Agromyces marinus]BDZ53745.1 hypothetical protein GCM10025870_08180 [Agromyces marinus]
MTIPYGRQSINEDDVAAVVAALRSDWLTMGPASDRFEADIAERAGTPARSRCRRAPQHFTPRTPQRASAAATSW